MVSLNPSNYGELVYWNSSKMWTKICYSIQRNSNAHLDAFVTLVVDNLSYSFTCDFFKEKKLGPYNIVVVV